MKRVIENKKNYLCKTIIDSDEKYYALYYNMINSLYLSHPDYMKIVFNTIKSNSNN